VITAYFFPAGEPPIMGYGQRTLFLSRVGRVRGEAVSQHFWGPWSRRRGRWFALGHSMRRWDIYAELRRQRALMRWRKGALGW
jgi:hypothetical protein